MYKYAIKKTIKFSHFNRMISRIRQYPTYFFFFIVDYSNRHQFLCYVIEVPFEYFLIHIIKYLGHSNTDIYFLDTNLYFTL